MENKNIDNNKLIDDLLEKIDRQLTKYEKYPGVTDIQQLIKDRIEWDNSIISSRESLLKDIKEWQIKCKQLEDSVINNPNKENIYDKEMWPIVISMLILSANNSQESERQIYRANYCLQSNNQIFRILDAIYNNNFSSFNESNIQEKAHVTRINIAMFLINYTFERLLIECKNTILVNLEKMGFEDSISFLSLDIDDKKIIINELLKKVKDVQLLGDILGELKCFDEKGELTNLLKQFDSNFNRKTPSKLKVIRNASSHGEFYPNMDNVNNIKLLIDNNGVQRYELTYFDIIELANDYVSLLTNKDNIETFLQLMRSNNLPITIDNLMKTSVSNGKLIESLCILSLYNVIQYNNEKHFRDNIELNQKIRDVVKIEEFPNKGKNYLEKFNMSYYFTPSFTPANSDDILQTIKYSISHINYHFDGEKITFINPQDETRSCSCNVGRLLFFIAEDDIYKLSSSTSYYEKVKKMSNKLVENYINGNYNIKIPVDREKEVYYQELNGVDNIDNINHKKS